MNELGIVVSRYYEDLKWIEQLKTPVDVYVYNRMGDSPGMGVPSAARTTVNPNKDKSDVGNLNIDVVRSNGVNIDVIEIEDDPGYEASTYSYHFYTKHDSLNTVTICLQAHPSFYIKDIIAYLNNPNQLMHTKFFESCPTCHRLNQSEKKTIKECIDFEFVSDNFAWLDPMTEYCWSTQKEDFTKAPWWSFVKGIPGWVEKDLKTLAGWYFGAGNQFMVNKKLVLKHDSMYYKEIQEFTKTYMDPHSDKRPKWQQLNQGPNILEGSWRWVF